MRLLLRAIALFAGFAVLATLWYVFGVGTRGWPALIHSGFVGVATIAGWLVTLIAGPIAAVQLFRLRRSGLVAALVLFGTLFAYYGAGLAILRPPGAPVGPILSACALFGVIVIVLVTPAASRACTSAHE